MIKNYFITAMRMLRRNRGYGILNIAGLAVGIACAALILLWVEDEVTYNDFPKTKNLYAVYENQTYGGDISTFHVSPGPLAAALKEEVAGVENVMRIRSENRLFVTGDKAISANGTFCDSSIFSMLDIHLVAGDPATVFDAGRPLVISETMSKKIYGNNNPVGMVLKMSNDKEYQITGVYSDLQQNSDFCYEWMAPFDVLVKDFRDSGLDFMDSWNNTWYKMYVELEPTAIPGTINEKIYELIPQKSAGIVSHKLFLYPLDRMHLYGHFHNGKEADGGFAGTVCTFTLIAAIILLIACINFMNLSTARSQKRALEIGIRKTFGAKRPILLTQFMMESAWMTLLSLIVAVLIITLVLPQFNTLVGKQLLLELGKPAHMLGIVGVGFLCCLLAGSYPAFYLSAFPPIDVLRRVKSKTGGEAILRKVLVVFQFAASLVLIICTAFIYLQIQYTKSRSLGMDINQVVMANISSDIKKNFDPLKQQLLATGVVDNVALSNQPMIQIWSNGGGYDWPGKPENVDPLVSYVAASSGLLAALNIEIAEGHDFESDNVAANKNKIIINETLAKIMGDEGRVGGRILQGNDSAYSEVIAVVKDFVFNNAYRVQAEPLAIWYYPDETSYIFIRLKGGVIQRSLDQVGSVVKSFNHNLPFEYSFMDDRFDRMFRSEKLTGKLAVLFAVLTIIISCLGLFGLAAFSAEQRTREIGIRKVLGATVWGITTQLGRSFMAMVLISFVVAIPVAWYIMHGWLQKFPYRVNESWTVFAAASLLVIIIAILTVSFQSIKAATANPVKSLKTE